LADYSEYLDEFRAAGAELVAISVDDATRAESCRQELGVKFPLLCDTSREVVKKYGLLNSGEKGGIALPASFVIDRNRVVQFRALEEIASRVSVDQLLELVREVGRGATEPQTKPRKRGVFPGLMFLRASMNALRHGVRSPVK
jgi:peroxiredoxin Q/BCP